MGAAVLVVFVVRQGKLAEPLIDLRPLKISPFAVGVVVNMLSLITIFAMSIIVPDLHAVGSWYATAGCFTDPVPRDSVLMRDLATCRTHLRQARSWRSFAAWLSVHRGLFGTDRCLHRNGKPCAVGDHLCSGHLRLGAHHRSCSELCALKALS